MKRKILAILSMPFASLFLIFISFGLYIKPNYLSVLMGERGYKIFKIINNSDIQKIIDLLGIQLF